MGCLTQVSHLVRKRVNKDGGLFSSFGHQCPAVGTQSGKAA